MQSVTPPATEIADSVRNSWPRFGSIAGSPNKSLFDALLPQATFLHRIAAAVFFIILIALLARARFYLPDNPVPITFQTFGILLTGGVLGWRWGLASVIGYYLVGMAGIPVFQGGGNGWQYVSGGVTGGYLLGFILATGIVGFLSQRGWIRGLSLWPMLLGALAIYAPALVWLSVFDFGWPSKGALFSQGMYPFVPGDVVKLVMASLLITTAWHQVKLRQKP